MATHGQIQPVSGARAPSLTAFIDRWIYVFMAVLLTLTVLIGFVPDSLNKIAAVQAGMRPPFPMALHVHAVLMGSWMLLLLAQTTLMATGRRDWHMQLGVLGMVLAPALVLAGVVLVPTNIATNIAFAANVPEAQDGLAEGLVFSVNIALVQLRVGICFLLFVVLALRARKLDSGLHKRLMILATVTPLGAATSRMAFLPNTLPESPETTLLWPILFAVPMFLWDLYRQRTIHRAYWIFAAVMLPSGILVQWLWNSAWWQSVGARLLY